MAGSGGYNNKGLYNSYDKSHKEREALDYYATDPVEVRNILDTLGLDFSNQTILEPCVGGGHMAQAIQEYIEDNGQTNVKLIGTDIQDRGYRSDEWILSYGKDFFADDYSPDSADYVILNPPYGVIEPFMIRTLEIAQKGVIMLARLQFLEGEKRYINILKDNPPTEIYVYVDRVQCWKNGTIPEGSSAQCYAWFVWNKESNSTETTVKWIRRSDKKD